MSSGMEKPPKGGVFKMPWRSRNIKVVDNLVRVQLNSEEGEDHSSRLTFSDSQVADDCPLYWEKFNEVKETDPLKKLRKLHKIAPPLKHYDASTPLTYMFSFKDTALQLTFQRLDFWILFLLHCSFSLAYHYFGMGIHGGLPDAPGWPKVSIALIASPGVIISILLPFYLNLCFSSYLVHSGNVGGAIGALGDFIRLLRVQIDEHSCPEAATVRQHLYNLIVAFSTLACTLHPAYRADKLDKWGWCYLESEKFLTKRQVEEVKAVAYDKEIINTSGRLAYREVLLWAYRAIWAQRSKGVLNPKTAANLTLVLWQIRSCLDPLYLSSAQLVPLAYYHLLNFLIIGYLFVLSYSFVFIAPMYSILGYFLLLTCILGVREIANSMSDPIGDDGTDIPMFDSLISFHKQAKALIHRKTSYGDEIEDLKPKDA